VAVTRASEQIERAFFLRDFYDYPYFMPYAQLWNVINEVKGERCQNLCELVSIRDVMSRRPRKRKRKFVRFSALHCAESK
jgi:hypothetical protein